MDKLDQAVWAIANEQVTHLNGEITRLKAEKAELLETLRDLVENYSGARSRANVVIDRFARAESTEVGA